MSMTEKKLNTVKPTLVTTSIKQKLVLCDLNLYFPSQCASYQLNIKLEFVASPLRLIGSESE
jgi:hypothetical protein